MMENKNPNLFNEEHEPKKTADDFEEHNPYIAQHPRCRIEPFSSQICSYGTRSCTVDHDQDPYFGIAT